MGADRLDLAVDFPAADEEQWRELVAAARHDPTGDAVAALTSRTYDGIEIAPLYTAAADVADPGLPGSPPYVRGATVDGATLTGWDVRTRIAERDAAAARATMLDDLERGGTSLWLVLGTRGLPVADLPRALDGVYLDAAPVVLDAEAETVPAARALLDLAGELDGAEIRGSLGADPVGLQARTGAGEIGSLADLAALARSYPNLCVATIDATVYHDAGAGDADEIGIATAVGVSYLRALTDSGLDVDEALRRLEFRFAVTADQFGSIAKLRAARQVWGRVAQLCDAHSASGELRGQRQHAVTSPAMLTRRDPWVNMLRTTVACFAAIVGGADAITVLPFDSAVGRPDEFGRRIARNTQAILHDESGLGRVMDAAGGSWYVETRTARLAEKAWDAFTEIERAGGIVTALEDGLVARRVAAVRDARADDIAHRRAPITGVSEFALPDEAPLTREPVAAPAGGRLRPARWAEPFERLRDEIEQRVPRPSVFLAALGPFGAHSRRVGFARNLFTAGGFRVVVGEASDFVDSGARVACLCGSDDAYRAEAGDAAAALRNAGARFVWLAGSTAVDGAVHGVDGAVDGVVTAGGDALTVLRTTAGVYGVEVCA